MGAYTLSMDTHAAPSYTCPMHPTVIRDKPGMCPECGMNLVPASKNHAQQNHGTHTDHATTSLLSQFWVAVALTIPIFFYSDMASMLFGIQAPQFAGSPYVLLGIASIVFFYCGRIFLTSAYRELQAKQPGMMTLIALAITAAYAYSAGSILNGSHKDLLFELCSLIAIMLLGHWIEMRSVQGAQGALTELTKLLPDTAEVIQGKSTTTIPLAELRVGNTVLVRPGAHVPADGRVVTGQSSLDESVITGESAPVEKTIGDTVIAGTINGDGSLHVVIEHIGDDTFLSGIMRLVAEAQASKSRLQLLSDRAAFSLTIIAVVVGSFTFLAWLAGGAGLATATERLVAVLVITCPHALGLAVPLVASISTTLAAQNGMLVRDRRALESAREITTVLFDKTGTLTKGEFGVSAILVAEAKTEEQLLLLAASASASSEHPLSKAIVAKAHNQQLALKSATAFKRLPGKGLSAVVSKQTILVGSPALLADYAIATPTTYETKLTKLARGGKTVIHVFTAKQLLGSVVLADIVRDESRKAITQLRALGIHTAMVTGDAEQVARWVANELGVDEFFAQVLPEDKAKRVTELQQRGQKVAMVGDGVNDAPALTQADLGIAIGAGTTVAIESAGIILIKNDPRDIVKIIRLSQLTYQKMIQNLFWATGYNVVAIPLAAGVLASRGIVLQPALAAALMSVSTVIVALNALLLRRQKL